MQSHRDAPTEPSAPAMTRVYNAGSLGRSIRELRTKRGLTQDQLAQSVGIPVRYISTLEQGHATAQLDRLLHVLSALDARLAVHEDADW